MNSEIEEIESSPSIATEQQFKTSTRAPVSEIDLADHAFREETRLTIPAALCDESLLEEIRAIPDKMGFKIGDVAEILGIKQYVLRYWESEFEILRPKKAANNQRIYTRRDVENVLLIRKLLHRDRFSIEGARAALKDLRQFVKKEKNWSHLHHRIETVQDRIDDVVMDIKRLRELFS